AQQTLGQRPAVMALDMAARMIDEMPEMHARRAGRHAGEAGEAAIDMPHMRIHDGLLGMLEHVLDQIDAAARRIELVAEQHIGRAGRGAKAAMHAFADDAGAFGRLGIGELGGREAGLHYIRPGFKMPTGSKLALTRASRAASAGGRGWKTGMAARIEAGARISVA